MPSFRYQAISADGSVQAGTLNAPDRTSALKLISQRGETPLEIEMSAADAAAAEGRRFSRPSISRAELADDLRREVRDLIRQGKTDDEIKRFLVSRYGDFVLYRPEVKPLTWVLWFGPFLLWVVGVWALARHVRQRRQTLAPAPLSAQDRQRAQDLLKG